MRPTRVTPNTNNKKSENNLKNSRELKYQVWHISACLFLFCFLFVYPFYFREGYTQITTRKFELLRLIGAFFGGLAFFICMIQAGLSIANIKKISKNSLKNWIRKNISITDIFVISYLIIIVVSYLNSGFREEAMWGADGWYMGMGTLCICIGIYLAISRAYRGSLEMTLIGMMIPSFVIFLWGLLNRFGLYPIYMENESPLFLACLGNINWFCGYWSVFFATGITLYLFSSRITTRIASGIYLLVALGLIAVEGSDSGFVSLGIVVWLSFFVSWDKRKWFQRYLEIIILMTDSWQILRCIVAMYPQQITKWSKIMELLLGNLSLVILLFAVLLRVIIDDEKDWKYRGIKAIKWGVTIALVLGLCCYMILLVINTNNPGSIKGLSNNPLFQFNDNWGSARGLTWKDGISIYKSFQGKEKWIGVGPDCFTVYAYTHPVLAPILERQFGGARLTNAHNECITILVNLGILGLVSFLGITGSMIIRCAKRIKREPLFLYFVLAIASYLVHNIFSFEQIINTPFLFCIMGLAENMLRRESKEKR